MTYKKVKPGDAAYDYVQALKKARRWVCDSKDHNDPKGCSNPECWKYKKKE